MGVEAAIARKATLSQIAIGFVFAVLVTRLFFIQVVGGPESVRAADRQHTIRLPDVPKRGDIVAADGTLLATSVWVQSLCADPSKIKNPAGVAEMLARAINLDPQRVYDKLTRQRADGRPVRFAWLARFLTDNDADAVKSLNIQNGIYFREEYKRYYPNGALLAHTLGFVTRDKDDRDDLGLEGLEYAYNDLLRGTPGRREVAADARRRQIPSIHEHGVPARDGQRLVLTIDPEIQAIAETALKKSYLTWKATSASVVVIRPDTGELLALCSLPNFDPNQFASSTPEQRRNRVISDAFDPGSTFKPLTVGLALALGAVTPQTMISVTGTVAGRTLQDHVHDATLSVHDVVTYSSNIGAARIAMMLSKEQLRNYVMALGFGRPTGLGLHGEAAGRVTPMARWNNYTQTSVAFGQEITTTPLQLASAYCALANSGVLMQPYLVKRIENSEGDILKSFEPKPIRRVLPYSTVKPIRAMLQSVVQEGTGKKAATKRYATGGKTGTAQKALPNGGGYSQTDFVAYFAGIAPVERPQLCVVVAVDTPQGNHYGGTVAAPVFAEIIAKSLHYLETKIGED